MATSSGVEAGVAEILLDGKDLFPVPRSLTRIWK